MILHRKREKAMIISEIPGYGEQLAWILIDAGPDMTMSERGPVPGEKIRQGIVGGVLRRAVKTPRPLLAGGSPTLSVSGIDG